MIVAAAAGAFGVRGPALAAQVTRSAATACAALSSLRLADVRITHAVAGPAEGARPAAVRVPNCRVTGVIGRDVEFVLILPDAWNERLVLTGNGGFAGGFGPLTPANDGYAVVSTNTGHSGSNTSARWALNDHEKVIEYGYLAVHETADAAKAIARAYYGTDARFSYFAGCSDGGREGLMEAQRYPTDFDGIVAGAPAYDFTDISASFIKNLQAVFPAPGGLAHGVVTPENLALLSAAVLAECDARDGVTDGMIDDPRRCAFKLSSVRTCAGDVAAPDCLTRAQRAAIERVYAPTVVNGKQIYPGQPVGGESDGWAAWITGGKDPLAVDSMYPTAQAAFAIEGFKYVIGDTTWNYLTYDLANLARDSRNVSPVTDAVDPDLSRFAAHGGKLLMYHGWADPALNPLATIEYYQQVLAHDPKAREYVRLFMLPAVAHCAGGAGPDQVAWLAALQAWREEGAVPQRLVAAKRARGAVVRTRPLCPYPQHAAYRGSGSTDDEANFVCREDR